MLVQIDIEACTDVVARMRAVADEAEHRHAVVRAAAVHARCSTSALAPVPALAAQLRDLARDLARRVDLAVEIDNARPGGLGGPIVSFEVAGDSEDTAAVARLLGQTLAGELAGCGGDDGEMVRLIATLARYATDADVVAGLVSTLGVQGIESLTRFVLGLDLRSPITLRGSRCPWTTARTSPRRWVWSSPRLWRHRSGCGWRVCRTWPRRG